MHYNALKSSSNHFKYFKVHVFNWIISKSIKLLNPIPPPNLNIFWVIYTQLTWKWVWMLYLQSAQNKQKKTLVFSRRWLERSTFSRIKLCQKEKKISRVHKPSHPTQISPPSDASEDHECIKHAQIYKKLMFPHWCLLGFNHRYLPYDGFLLLVLRFWKGNLLNSKIEFDFITNRFIYISMMMLHSVQ